MKEIASRDDSLCVAAQRLACVCGAIGIWVILRDARGAGHTIECVACGTIVPAETAMRRLLEIAEGK